MNRGIKFVPFCVLATILTASCPARANTIIFQCGTSFAVDLKNNTVNNQPATINATAIDWQLIPGPANDTGVDPTTYRCTVGSARPTIPRFRRESQSKSCNTFRPKAGCYGHGNLAFRTRSPSHLCTVTRGKLTG